MRDALQIPQLIPDQFTDKNPRIAGPLLYKP